VIDDDDPDAVLFWLGLLRLRPPPEALEVDADDGPPPGEAQSRVSLSGQARVFLLMGQFAGFLRPSPGGGSLLASLRARYSKFSRLVCSLDARVPRIPLKSYTSGAQMVNVRR
jgi:hypothetical protein